MYKFLSKNGQLIAFLLGLIVTGIFLASIFGGLEQYNALAEDQRSTTNIFDFGLYAGMALTGVCLALALFFGLIQTLSNPKAALKGLLGIAALVGMYFAGQSFAGADTPSIVGTLAEFSVNDTENGFINGAIGGGLIMLGLSLVTFVLSELMNLFK